MDTGGGGGGSYLETGLTGFTDHSGKRVYRYEYEYRYPLFSDLPIHRYTAVYFRTGTKWSVGLTGKPWL